MKPSGLHHVSINVDDVDASLAFSVDALGLEVRTDRPDLGFAGAWLDVGGQQVHLIEAAPPPDRGQHFALSVDDLASVVAELRGRGLQVSEPRLVGTGLQAFLSDPAGNVVELQQPGVEPA